MTKRVNSDGRFVLMSAGMNMSMKPTSVAGAAVNASGTPSRLM